jgi:hypothetical protein
LSAGELSRKPIKTWSLLVPGDASQFEIQPPSQWRSDKIATKQVDRSAARHAPLISLDFSHTNGFKLEKGMSAGEFRLVSNYLPGYVSSYIRSKAAVELSPEQLDSLPKSIKDEMSRMLSPEWDSQSGLAIGPRFRPDTPKILIIDSFNQAIFALTSLRRLDQKSEFVVAATQFLHSYLEQWKDNPVSVDQLAFLNKAATPAEQEFAFALKTSLSVNP